MNINRRDFIIGAGAAGAAALGGCKLPNVAKLAEQEHRGHARCPWCSAADIFD